MEAHCYRCLYSSVLLSSSQCFGAVERWEEEERLLIRAAESSMGWRNESVKAVWMVRINATICQFRHPHRSRRPLLSPADCSLEQEWDVNPTGVVASLTNKERKNEVNSIPHIVCRNQLEENHALHEYSLNFCTQLHIIFNNNPKLQYFCIILKEIRKSFKKILKCENLLIF